MTHKEEMLLLVLIFLFSPRDSDILVAFGGKIPSPLKLSDVPEWLKDATRRHLESACEGPCQGISHSRLLNAHHVEEQMVKHPTALGETVGIH